MDGAVGGGPKEGWARGGKTKMKREKKNLLTGGSYMRLFSRSILESHSLNCKMTFQ
jgi:hypothetical protein